ncbi:TetR/AcrR family transcriptional regulator [Planotetraspora sp. GP83]|uniref:TetR/AcrR family transcriptional regulator n=1 Tax=Planotetraspora sp. GP83 TaxID=3156264 RepID=UPI0035154D29
MVKKADSAAGAGGWRVYEELSLPPILANAIEAFEEHGYHGTTVRDIARRVGVTVPALYYHYENKQALLVELLMSSIQTLLERCEAALAEAGDDPVRRFSALVECVVLNMAYRGSQGLLDSEIRSLEPENREKYVGLRDELEAKLHAIIMEGVDLGVFRTEYPVEAGRAVLTMCQAVARWYRPSGPLPPGELAERYVAIGLGAVGYKPPTRRKPRPGADAGKPGER